MTAHAEDEHVEIESMLRVMDILDRFMDHVYDGGKNHKQP
jgi:acetylornithine deacetylase/succinyl-diaminopimelate desuccinylase-like protein